jgi:Rrf2 family protein
MHLTSQEEYGLRCLLQVAHHDGPEPLNIAQIATAEGISPEYTAKLMRLLRQGGLVASTRGAGGGYRLARNPGAITLWDAVQVLGSPFFPDTFCSAYPGQLPDCVHTPDCSIRVVWGAVAGAVRGVLDRITLADLNSGEQSAAVKLGALVPVDHSVVAMPSAPTRDVTGP